MSLINYLKMNKPWLISSFFIIAVINFILIGSSSINKSLTDILYMDMLILSIEFTAILYGFIKDKKKFKSIAANNFSPYKGDFYVDTLSEALETEHKAHILKEDHYKKNINELQEYITQWTHDIKVNIAVCDLLLENTSIENGDKLSMEMEKIKFMAEQVLYVTRANHYSQDVAAEQVDVSKELRNAIKDNSLFFINKGIEINADLKPFSIVSDKKWIHYIFNQILNNSSKYTPVNGKLLIFSEEDDKAYYIHIKDNGIGIPKEDINRIFDKGFTGRNGRIAAKSTGMGLYYAKKMAENLSIGIEVKSKVSEFTEFIITFYKLSDYYNITPMSH